MAIKFNGNRITQSGKVFELHRFIGFPERKTNIVSIPTADGVLDLTDYVSEYPVYNNREIKITLECKDYRYNYLQWYYYTLGQYNGKRVKIEFTDDPTGYYYMGKVTLGELEDFGLSCRVEITIDADPYRYEGTKMQCLGTIGSSGEDTIPLECYGAKGWAEFFTEGSFTVSDGVDTWNITSTKTKCPGLELRGEETQITITGTPGTDYRIEYYGGHI